MSEICILREKLVEAILNPLLLLVFAIGFLVFVYGVIEFMWGMNAGSTEDAKQNGKWHMLYGVLGMFVMVSAYAFVNIIINTVGGSVEDCTVCPNGLPPGPGGVCGGRV